MTRKGHSVVVLSSAWSPSIWLTHALELSHHQSDDRLWVLAIFRILLDDLFEDTQAFSKRIKKRLCIRSRLIHGQEDPLSSAAPFLRLTHPHRGYLTVRRRGLSALADGEEEETEKTEHICNDGIDPIRFGRRRGSGRGRGSIVQSRRRSLFVSYGVELGH